MDNSRDGPVLKRISSVTHSATQEYEIVAAPTRSSATKRDPGISAPGQLPPCGKGSGRAIRAAWIIALPAVFLAVSSAVSPLSAGEAAAPYQKITDIDGKRIGVLTGTLFDYLVNDSLDHTQLFYYDTLDPMLGDLNGGKLDCIVGDEPGLRSIAARDPRYRVIPDGFRSYEYALLFQEDETELASEFDRELEAMRKEGLIDALIAKWMRGDGEATADTERHSGSRLVRLGVFTEAPPFVFRDLQNNIVGIDIEIVEHICRRLGYRLEVTPMSMDSLFDSLAEDTSDVVAASISITNERRQLGIFGVPYHKADVTALVMADH